VSAHESLAEGAVRLGTGALNDASANRSIVAFNKNPDASGNPSINPEVVQLRLDRPSGAAGAISWFSVHNTSLSRDNRLISSDHKGYAAYLFEKLHGTIQPFVNSGKFIAAFPNGDEGDQSPNINPGFLGPASPDEFKSMRIIGGREFAAANEIFNHSKEDVLGDVDFRHTFVRMPGYHVGSVHVNGAGQRTLCRGAYGASFAAGAEDGPSGVPGFAEGMTFNQKTPAEWVRLSRIFNARIVPQQWRDDFNAKAAALNDDDSACHRPKPVLIPSSSLGWSGDILPFQILKLGSVAIAGVPGEMTVQAGRRLREHLLLKLGQLGVSKVILTGLANDYSGYIATPEEYDTQQYEGASTLFGRLTLDAYIQIFSNLATDMVSGSPSEAGPTPPDLSASQRSFQTGVIFDDKPVLEVFGQVLKQPPASVREGDVVDVTFRGGHPKNNLMTGTSYYFIERKNGDGSWSAKVWDSMPEGRFSWRRDTDELCRACSFVDVHWDVPDDVEPGTYRISHKGAWKNGVTGAVTIYQGYTNTFAVGSQPGNASDVVPPIGSATPCGGDGQRACCVNERVGGLLGKECTGDLIPKGSCQGAACVCGGNNPNGLLRSMAMCTKPPAAQEISACGGIGQRGCCVSERAGGLFGKPCTGNLREAGRCSGNCTCGGKNPGGATKSMGICVR